MKWQRIARLLPVLIVSHASAQVLFFESQTDWENALPCGTTTEFAFTASNVALADEVASAPTCTTTTLSAQFLTFKGTATGLATDFQFETGRGNDPCFTCLSVGRIAACGDSDHDWSFQMLAGEPVLAVAMSGLNGSIGQYVLSVTGSRGVLGIHSFDGDEDFIGVIATEAIVELLMADVSTPGGVGVQAITFFGDSSVVTPSSYCTPKVSSEGCVTAISTTALSSIPCSGGGDYFVTATSVQEIKNGLLFAGISGSANIPFNGGILCVNPPTKRGRIMNSGGDNPNECDGTFSTLVNDGMVIPAGLDAGAGNTAWYQYWYRDPGNGAGQLGTALSNAVELNFL